MGDRRQVNTEQPRVLADAAAAEAARRGMTLTDYIGTLLAKDLGMVYAPTQYDPQEALSLSLSA